MNVEGETSGIPGAGARLWMLGVDGMRWVVSRAVFGGDGGDLASMRGPQDRVTPLFG